MSDEDRKHDATPQRREEFRKEGRFARARDAGGIAAAFGVIAVLAGSRGLIRDTFGDLAQRTLGDVGALSRGDSGPLRTAALALVAIVVPCALAAMTGGLVLGFAQAGARLDLDLISPKAQRLDPFAKLQQLLTPGHALTELGGSVLRVGAASFVAYRALVLELPNLQRLSYMPVSASAEQLGAIALRVAVAVLVALSVVAVGDYVQSRITIEGQMKMTQKEMMEQMRQQDGDPKQKARQRSRARAVAKQRSLQGVKNASVIVTNPTHVAVAIRYGKKDRAPVVVAKGHDEVALHLRRVARRHGIPILESRALARALDADVPLGGMVPEQHYLAVARILSFVYSLRGTTARDVLRSTP